MNPKIDLTSPGKISEDEPAWLSEKRKEALDIFKTLPEPNRKEEEWKYTDFSVLRLDSIESTGKVKQTIAGFEGTGSIVCDIKTAAHEHSDLLKKYLFAAINPRENRFVALHCALFSGGAFVYIPKGIRIEKPLLLSSIAEGSALSHTVIVAESGSSFTLIQDLQGKPGYFSNFVELFLLEGAEATVLSFHNLSSGKDFSINRAVLGRDSNLKQVFGVFGGDFSRLRFDCLLNGEGAEAKYNGVYIGAGKQNIEMHTSAVHSVPHTTYDILARGALFGSSTAVHHGVNKIEKTALGANSWLRGHTLLFGDKSKSDIIPSLQIDTNDVQAGHEASVGKVDEEQLFYLMSRGLERREAERLIVQGYFEPILKSIPDEVLRGKIRTIVEGKIDAA